MSSLSVYSSPPSNSPHTCPCCGNPRTRSVPAILHNDVRTVRSQRYAGKVGHYRHGNGGSMSISSFEQVASTPLVEALTPPPKPKMPKAPRQPCLRHPPSPPSPPPTSVGGNYGRMAMVGGAGCLALPLVALIGLVMPFVFALYLLAIPGALVYFAFRASTAPSSQQTQHNRLEYEQALARWQQNRPIYEANAQAQLASEMTQWRVRHQAWQERCASIELRWQRAMDCWNALFYCDRCDSVFLPATGEHVPLTLAKQLLWRHRSNP